MRDWWWKEERMSEECNGHVVEKQGSLERSKSERDWMEENRE